MSEVLSFPGLGWEFTLNRVAFQIGPFGSFGPIYIYWYGIIIAAAFLAGIVYVLARAKKFGVDSDRLIDVIFVGTIGAVICARLYYVVFSWDQYKDNLGSIFKIWEGGLAIYGGLIGALIFGALMCKLRRVKLLPTLDLVAGGLILGQAIGRWGNFVNIEAYGSNTALPWGMTGPKIVNDLKFASSSLEQLGVHVDPNIPVHPTFFYESIWCLLGFFFLLILSKHRKFDGEVFLAYSAWYGAGRFVIEGLRTDSLLIGNLRVSQLVALICFLGATALIVAIRIKIREKNDPDFMPLYINTEEGQAVINGTFYHKKGEENQPEEKEDTGVANEEATLNQPADETELKDTAELSAQTNDTLMGAPETENNAAESDNSDEPGFEAEQTEGEEDSAGKDY